MLGLTLIANVFLQKLLQLKGYWFARGLHTFFISFFFVLENMGTLFAMFFCYFRTILKLVCLSVFWTFNLTGIFLCFFYYYFQAQQYLLFCLLVLTFTYLYVIMLICIFFLGCSNMSTFVGYPLRVAVQSFSFSFPIS